MQLQEKRGQLPAVAYTAQATTLRERIRSLQERINGTERTAQRVGVNASALDRLRTQTANMSGPEVSAVARNITDAPRGPPGESGPPDRAAGQNNRPSPKDETREEAPENEFKRNGSEPSGNNDSSERGPRDNGTGSNSDEKRGPPEMTDNISTQFGAVAW
jgi:hypothetical protein